MKNKKMMLKGSFVIEASIIMPVIIIIIALLVYLSFFIYNRCIITHLTYVAALRGSLSQEDPDKTEQNIVLEEKDLFSNRLLAVDNIQFENKIDNTNINVTASVFMHVPYAAYAAQLKIKGTWGISVRKKAEQVDALLFIRNCRKLENLLKQDTDK